MVMGGGRYKMLKGKVGGLTHAVMILKNWNGSHINCSHSAEEPSSCVIIIEPLYKFGIFLYCPQLSLG